MTHDIAHIIEKYEAKDALDIAASPTITRDITLIGQSIENKNSSSAEAKEFLKGLMKKIEKAIQDTESEIIKEKDTSDRVQKMAEACVAYLKTQ